MPNNLTIQQTIDRYLNSVRSGKKRSAAGGKFIST